MFWKGHVFKQPTKPASFLAHRLSRYYCPYNHKYICTPLAIDWPLSPTAKLSCSVLLVPVHLCWEPWASVKAVRPVWWEPCCSGNCLSAIPISHHEYHPGCGCSIKCIHWVEAGQGLLGRSLHAMSNKCDSKWSYGKWWNLKKQRFVMELKGFAVCTWGVLLKNYTLSSFISLQQVEETGDSHPELCLPKGRLSHYLYTLFG